MKFALEPVRENSCATGNIGDPARSIRLKMGNNLVLCRTINPTLKYLKVARGGGEIPEPSDCVC
jgi:hypothetical protein